MLKVIILNTSALKGVCERDCPLADMTLSGFDTSYIVVGYLYTVMNRSWDRYSKQPSVAIRVSASGLCYFH